MNRKCVWQKSLLIVWAILISNKFNFIILNAMKTMKFAAAFLMVAMVLASCGNSKSNESQETEQTPVEVFSVTPSESSSDESRFGTNDES